MSWICNIHTPFTLSVITFILRSCAKDSFTLELIYFYLSIKIPAYAEKVNIFMSQPRHLEKQKFCYVFSIKNLVRLTDFFTTLTILQRSVAVRPRDTLMFGDLGKKMTKQLSYVWICTSINQCRKVFGRSHSHQHHLK